MKDKQFEIMKSAIKLFSKKGYFSTSMQEIAEDCGISKGSLYKYFESKEELLVKVFEYNHDKMIQRAKFISSNQSLTPKETLRQLIVIEIEGIVENKDYFNLISKSLPIDKNKQFKPLMQRIRAEMLTWHKDTLIQVYGSKIEAIVWDLVIALQGIVKEFIYLRILDQKKVESELVADFVVFSMDAIVGQEQAKIAPVLTDVMMEDYQLMTDKIHLTTEDQILELLNQIEEKIKPIRAEGEDKEGLYSSVLLLKEEVLKKEPRLFLIDSLLAYLDKRLEVESQILTIKKLLDLHD
ncbi:TetR family transcriptional regulator [Aquibacillus halophilus]|uniref:TetR family transcriptional regulator n=1 Tax=Aquibacillus halophilus TaxID=930132 RepID=A0A6A8DL80_9BACI|nr:TetR/AcrR family transcriptional regulator [Aquibacillus halophilus]MRH43747.1 TetR family transcriptional regulator [Aquibacillus halophilus]